MEDDILKATTLRKLALAVSGAYATERQFKRMHTLIFDEGSIEEREKAQEALERAIRQRQTSPAAAHLALMYGESIGNMKVPCGHTYRGANYLFKLCRIYGIEIPRRIRDDYDFNNRMTWCRERQWADMGTTWVFNMSDDEDDY